MFHKNQKSVKKKIAQAPSLSSFSSLASPLTKFRLKIIFRCGSSGMKKKQCLWLLPFQKKAELVVSFCPWLQGPIAVVFCDEKKIKSLNLQFRGKNLATDVLTFPAKFSSPEPSQPSEIYLCLEKIQAQAKNYELSLEIESIRLFVHSLAHLKGWDHENNPDEEKLMLNFEKQLLAKLGIFAIYD